MDKGHRVIRTLVCIPRGRPDLQGRHEEEHRIALCEYNGNPYISMRVFWLARDGEYYPSKKGDTIRLGEAEEVAAAILEGVRIARDRTSAGRPEAAPRRHPRQGTPPPAARPLGPSAPREVQLDALDEFAEYRK